MYSIMMYIRISIVLQTPTVEELINYVSPSIKEMWFKIGVLLGLPAIKLEKIKRCHGNDLHSCCVMMLTEWSLGKPATWEHLLSVIDRVPHKTQNLAKNTVEVNKDEVTLDDFRKKGI